MTSGSSTDPPTKLPASAHWARPGFQPLVSAVTAMTSFPPGVGVPSFTVVAVEAESGVLLFEQAAPSRPTVAATAALASAARRQGRCGRLPPTWSGVVELRPVMCSPS